MEGPSEFELVQLLGAVAVASNEAQTVEEGAGRCLEAVCATLGVPVGHLYLRDEHGGLASTSVWHVADRDRYRALVESTTAARVTRGAGLAGVVLATGEPIWLSD